MSDVALKQHSRRGEEIRTRAGSAGRGRARVRGRMTKLPTTGLATDLPENELDRRFFNILAPLGRTHVLRA